MDKINREERIYSVTMTEDELRLFSEFLGQKEFDKNDYEDFEEELSSLSASELEEDKKYPYHPLLDEEVSNEIIRMPAEHEWLGENGIPVEVDEDAPKSKEDINKVKSAVERGLMKNKNISDGRKVVGLQKVNTMTSTFNPYIDNDYSSVPGLLKDGKHRMSFKYAKDLDKEGRKLIEDIRSDADLLLKEYKEGKIDKSSSGIRRRGYELGEKYEYNTPQIQNIVSRTKTAEDLINKESDLAKSKYDDKYSSKRFEKFLDKKIDADKANNIVDRRHKKDTDYLVKDTEKGRDRDKFHISDIGRKWNDAGIVYNEALDRNLNKDAAIAAGVTAGLVGGGIALRKHLKRKKQEKELAEKKYKTSDKKKK